MHIQRLSESIEHIDELPVDEFIHVLRNMSGMVAQEKLDGSNLWVGRDEGGRVFTSREGKRKSANKMYSASDWPKVSTNNQFIVAHLAIEKIQDQLIKVLRPGDTVEAEVLFGDQPNSVTYGADNKSYLAFLRGVLATPDAIADQLGGMLNNQVVEVQADLISSADGKEVQTNTERLKVQFTVPRRIDPSKLQSRSLNPEIEALERFLRSKSPIAGFSNGELALASLNSIPKEHRAAGKMARADVLNTIETDFKLPIKGKLIDTINQLERSFKSPTGDDSVGIEGVVLRDPVSGKQVKIVDKDVFSEVNKFNQSFRAKVQGPLNTVDPEASIESRGGLVGELRIKIAAFLGNRELAKPAVVRKLLEPIKGESPEDAIRNMAKTMPAVNDVQGAKRKIGALIEETLRELDDMLSEFKQNQDSYSITLKNGKEYMLSKETIKKTLATFAEARRNIRMLGDKISQATSVPQLLATLYGQSATAVHQPKDLTEQLLLERKQGEIAQQEYHGKTTFELLNIYLCTVFMSMVIYHANDRLGMRKLNDRRNYMMQKHRAEMSPLNHWGYAIWRSNRPELKKHLSKKVVESLTSVSKHIRSHLWKQMHMQLSWNRDLKVEWKQHRKLLRQLIDLSGIRTDRLNSLLDIAIKFDRLSYEDQLAGLKQLIAFARRFIPRSSLLIRMTEMEDKMKDTKEKIVAESLLTTVVKLAEDGEGGGGEGGGGMPGGDMPALSTATSVGAIATLPMRVGSMRRRTELRRRNMDVIGMLKKFKDPRKESK